VRPPLRTLPARRREFDRSGAGWAGTDPIPVRIRRTMSSVGQRAPLLGPGNPLRNNPLWPLRSCCWAVSSRPRRRPSP